MISLRDDKNQPIMMQVTGYLTIAAVGIVGITVVDPGFPRWALIFLIVAFTTSMTIGPGRSSPDWKKHLYLSIQSIFIALMFTLGQSWSVFPILFFVLASQAMLILPQKWGLTWIGIITLISGVAFVAINGWRGGLLILLPYTGGYIFFAAFASALARAEEAQQRSEDLLAELQIANQQLKQYADQVEELAVAEERNRLAREMHDTIGHRLTVSAVQLEGAHKLISKDPTRAETMVGVVREQVKDALYELRSTVATLREPLYAGLSLQTAVRRVIESFERASDLNLKTHISDDLPDVSDAYRIAFSRALQESLTNIQKHANAQFAHIDLAMIDGMIELKVSDDGKGLSGTSGSEDDRIQGFGLLGMRERAGQLGGSVTISDRDGGGTVIKFRLPEPGH